MAKRKRSISTSILSDSSSQDWTDTETRVGDVFCLGTAALPNCVYYLCCVCVGVQKCSIGIEGKPGTEPSFTHIALKNK